MKRKIRPTARLALTPMLALLTALTLTDGAYADDDEFAGQRVVNIREEPRHRIMHRDEDLYVIDVQINPGDTTLPHTHDSAILYTFISNGEGPLDGRVSSITRYVDEHYTHQVSNAGPGLFRIIALANYGPPQQTEDAPAGLAPELENDWFRSYRLTLEPGASSELHLHANPVLVVQVSDGVSHVSREDGITAELGAMGDWTWRDADSPFRIQNRSMQAVTLVVNEARR